MKRLVFTFLAMAAIMLTSCHRLSEREKAMVGSYFISEISDVEPLYELNSDGTSRMHAIRPEVVSFWVEGEWGVDGDKLVIKNDTTKVHVNGDSKLVGDIPEHVEHTIVDYNGTTLTLDKKGVTYIYHRRPEIDHSDEK